MSDAYNRRQFLNQMAAVGTSIPIAANLASVASSQQAAKTMDKVRIGFVGVGRRGQDDLRNLLKTEGVEILAICDVAIYTISVEVCTMAVMALMGERNCGDWRNLPIAMAISTRPTAWALWRNV